MDLAETFKDRRSQVMLGLSVFFMFLFPIYFAMVPGLVGLDDSSSASGPSGLWTVSFTEETLTQSETTDALSDGDTHEDTFVITEEMIGDNKNLASVTMTIQCQDQGAVGPGQNNGVDASSDVSGVGGELEDQTDGGNCGNGNAASMTWVLIDGYDGADYEADGTESDIRSRWMDSDDGRGDWIVELTADVQNDLTGFFVASDDQTYDITWTATIFEVSMQPVVDIEDPTTA
ncbi:MAG: hypothetical protein VXW89_04105 [Candidatus Thermoplasmatota archaeon]|nr:hypothetical protein [Candidatus Thermoplasmatota archaeon]MEE3029653.1 hypothetical protein [Candidatus Thermoplasmatota archaeon]